MFDKLQDSAIATIISITLLIAILILLFMLYIMLRSKLFNSNNLGKQIDKLDSTAVSLDDDIEAPKAAKRLKPVYKSNEEDEVVAAIVAAICAYSGLSMQQFKIKSVKMIDNDSNWRKQNLI